MSSIKPRAFPLSALKESIPRHWLGGSVLATHLANGVNLLFPAGERFFVRSVRHYLDRIADDPELALAVKGFAGQEGHHARAHEEVFAMLERQGYSVKPFLRVYEAIAYGVLERVFPPSMRLATTAAAEHFTAVMAENFLALFEGKPIDPTMHRLLVWHACEEIEHRAVAFDVLAKVDGRYSIRMGGLALATATLAGFWIAGTIHLLAQEKDVLAAVRRELAVVRQDQPFGERVFGRGIREYIRRDLHPHDRADLDAMAEKALAELSQFGIAPVERTASA